MNATLSDLEPGLERAAASYVRAFAQFSHPRDGMAYDMLMMLRELARLSGLSLHPIAQRHLAALRQQHGRLVWLMPAWWTWRRVGYRGHVPPRPMPPTGAVSATTSRARLGDPRCAVDMEP